ncbi:MAG: 50S ribosomal protein L9 [Thermomicrobiales bacterium]|nr:50S ribosomal protein L9 [Thermomicrobiales bacterium]
MKIILRQDVPKLGEKGTVQTVADGYARNYLIPQGFAVLATAGELKTLAENQKVADRKIARQEAELQSLADRIAGKTLTFEARAGSGGRLYGSITNADIAEKLGELVGAEIDRRKVVLDDPIRTAGEHTVAIHLVGKLRPQVTVVVNGEVDEEEAATEDETETEIEAE